VSTQARAAGLRPLRPERLGDHLDRLYRAALAMCGSSADAEDLVQETYLGVLRRPRLLRSEDDLGYLMRVMRNVLYSRHHRDTRRRQLEELAEALETRRSYTDAAVADAREVLAAVARLPAPYRDAVAAVDLAGLTYHEAARALGVRPGTIMSRLHRGRGQVAEVLG
jgi:RNA polymerase sigma-70 factor, ECF subfamily